MSATALRDVALGMHRVLRQETPVAEGAAWLGVDPRRLEIYRDFVETHVRKTLGTLYPIAHALLGEARWETLGRRFFCEHPPSSWEINEAVRPFPAFLSRLQEAGEMDLAPAHVAFASFEWEEFATLVHPASIPAPETLASPVLNPTATLLELPVPVVPFLVRWQKGERDPHPPIPDPSEGSELVLLFRNRATERVAFYRAVDDLLFALKVAHEGLDPVAAAREAGLPEVAAAAAWERAVSIGLVVAPRPDIAGASDQA